MRRRHVLAALGMLAPACSSAPVAHRSRAPESAPSAPSADMAQSAGAGDVASPASLAPATTTTTTEAPTTTEPPVTTVVTVTVPTAPRRTTTTFVLPERADDDMGDVEWAIRQAFPETPDKAVRVARCESGLQPGAISPDGANWGLLQVNVVHRGLAARMGYSWDQMLHTGPNLAVARAVYDAAGGWGPWSCA